MRERIEVASPRRGPAPAVPQEAAQVGELRRDAAARLVHWGLEDLVGEVMVIMSELLANALLHSGTELIVLDVRVRDGFLVVTVIDGMPGHATLRPAADDAESGRGLVLVESLAEACGGTWGVSRNGAETWCRLPVPTAERPRERPRSVRTVE
ncbi:ATP-binding protein [Streptomyces sp. NPDC059894]